MKLLDQVCLQFINSLIKKRYKNKSQLKQFMGEKIIINFGILSIKWVINENGYFYSKMSQDQVKKPKLILDISPEFFYIFMLHGKQDALRSVKMSGDTELAIILDKLLDHIQIDHETFLSKIVGDLVAYRLSKLISFFKKNCINTTKNIVNSQMNFFFENETIFFPRILRQQLFNQLKLEIIATHNQIACVEKRIEKLILISE